MPEGLGSDRNEKVSRSQFSSAKSPSWSRTSDALLIFHNESAGLGSDSLGSYKSRQGTAHEIEGRKEKHSSSCPSILIKYGVRSTNTKMGHVPVDETTPLIPHGHKDDTNHTFENDGNVHASEDASSQQTDLVKVLSITSGLEPSLERVTSATTAPPEQSETDGGHKTYETTYADRFMNVTPRQFWIIFGGIQLGYFVGFFDSTLMASAHPVITSYFKASNSASWLSTAFLLTSTALLPMFGRISDTLGRRPVYLFSIVMFLVTTIWCAAAQSIGSFIAARAVCGIGAGGVFSLGSIICSDIVRLEYRGIYQSYINATLGIASACGYAGGGILCDYLGWRGAFAIQVPFILAYLVLAAWSTPPELGLTQPKDQQPRSIAQLIRRTDITGSVLLTLGVSALIIGINLGGNVLSWGHPVVIGSLCLAVVFTVIMPWYENKVEVPVMPLWLLSSNPSASIIYSNFFGAIAVNTVMFNVPLFFQAVKLESATQSGLNLLASTLAATCSSVMTGFLITWSRRMKLFAVIGSVFLVLGGVATTLLTLVAKMPYILTLIFIALASFGQGFSFPTFTIAILAVNRQEDQAICVSTMGLWRNLGFVLGIASSSLILQNALRAYLEMLITGPDKEQIILLVRKSVEAVATLDPVHQKQGMCQKFSISE